MGTKICQKKRIYDWLTGNHRKMNGIVALETKKWRGISVDITFPGTMVVQKYIFLYF